MSHSHARITAAIVFVFNLLMMDKRLELQLPVIESYDFKIKHNKKYWYALIFLKLHCESCFSWICCQSQQKLTRKITQFTRQFHSKNVTHFTNLSSLTILKTYSINTVKNLTQLTNFLATMFMVGVRKNICNAPFLDAQELHF